MTRFNLAKWELDMDDAELAAQKQRAEADARQRRRQEALDEPIASLPLSVRTINTLEDQGILFVNQLLKCCPTTETACHVKKPNCKNVHLLSIANFGDKTLAEVFEALESIGFARPGHERKVQENMQRSETQTKNRKRRRFPST